MLVLPRDDLKKQEMLEKVMTGFEEDREYDESELNNILKSLNVDDHAMFRRELVNFNYLGKNSYKGIYWVKTKKLSEEELSKIGNNQDKIKEFS